MIQEKIRELVNYGLLPGLVEPEDEVYTVNRLLELFGLDEFEGSFGTCPAPSEEERNKAVAALPGILEAMLDYAAENGILKVGRLTDFQAHQIEHQLGAYTDCNHGQGLAVIHPAYYRHILKDAEEKFTRFAKEVFGKNTAEEGLEARTAFIKECGLPTKLNQLKSKVEITPEVLRKVADTCNIIKCGPRELSRDEIYDILL